MLMYILLITILPNLKINIFLSPAIAMAKPLVGHRNARRPCVRACVRVSVRHKACYCDNSDFSHRCTQYLTQ